ncbi:hypothetical protein CPB83DRAFT_863074, partial [Crepidotus variabilis]
MAPWSIELMDCFVSSKPALETFFAPAAYNKLLSTLFPVDTLFSILPQVHHHD